MNHHHRSAASTFFNGLLNLARIRISIRAEKPIPEEMNYREIIIRVPVMNEMQLLFASEPCKPLKP